ncbi:hypothetical protein A2125_00820 [Candidatus Woesebacteria bacterium GWB1_43_5]|uniref:FecR protein domain-containing protein n=1 Tax=Candidatus Woesebacteria bacterium GWB1_43_5 TaxID=1802474 RepID=A0A1F7WSR6_9BACT|nr:MAG: hypothetical protein A2125_00820 [Candidatus Woesebacteria bacterium GWB1_43_5]
MKKILLVVVALVLVAVIVGGYLLVKKSAQASITIFKETGEVMHKPDGGDYATISSDELNIPNRSFVKTGGDGLAHVILPDNSMISLSTNTEMQINYNEKTNIIQSLGNAWFRVQKLAGKGEFTVKTPTSVATVRGTIFGVEMEDGGEVVYVTEDSVEIGKDLDHLQNLAENKLATLAEGKTEITDIPQEKKQTPWFRRNEIINREFERGNPREFIKRLRASEEIKVIDEELKLLRVTGKQTLGTESGLFENFTTEGWWKNNTEACAYINSTEYAQATQELQNSRGFLGDWGDWIVKAIEAVKRACGDGVIGAGEASEIEKLYVNQPQMNFSSPVAP